MHARSLAIVGSLLALWLSLSAGSIVVTPSQKVDPSGHEVVFAVPVGKDGVHYEGEQIEMLTWGPATLAIAPDGSFWIADTVGNRLLRYSSSGSALQVIDLIGHAVGISDLEVSSSAIWVLDIAATTPGVLRISLDGEITARYELPEYLQREHGLSGIALIDKGDVVIEREGGASIFRLIDTGRSVTFAPLEGYTYNGRTYTARSADMRTAHAANGLITHGELSTAITAPHHLGGLYILGARPDGGLYVVVEEVTLNNAGEIQVDQTVRQYDAAGGLQGIARVPLTQQHTYVAHGLAVGPDSAVYALVTRPDRVEVQRLRFAQTLEPILAPGDLNRTNQDTGGMFITQSCVSRDSMMSIAREYVNNSKYLSQTNTDGSCSGRGKPRYIAGADTLCQCRIRLGRLGHGQWLQWLYESRHVSGRGH